MDNQSVARILKEIGVYLEMDDVAFKPRAFEKASEIISSLEESVLDIYKKGGIKALEEIPGVGVSIAGIIEELIKTGKSKEHEILKKKIPVNLEEFMAIEGLGPKTIKTLYKKLKIKNLNSLEKAAKEGKIRKLEGFGEKSEENILKSIEFHKKSGGRFISGFILPLVREIESRLKKIKGVEKAIAAGSVRRKKETIGDIDILAVSENPKPVMDFFVNMPEVASVIAHGDTKSAIKLNNGLDADLRVVPKESFGAALNYFTGSKDHNIEIRRIAMAKGYKLNEYGLFKGKKQIAGKSEEELYEALGLHYIEPELREMTGEVEASRTGKLPKLINYGDLKGDLHVHSDWTDGEYSIEEMVRAAIAGGLEYVAITDHTKHLTVTNGLDEKRIKSQWLEIDRLNKKFSGKIKILKGSECDILKDGTMDLPDEILSRLDVVCASVHSLFNLPKGEQTARIKKAMDNPNVDIISHPTGRLINRRSAYEVDMDELIKHAKKIKTIMEINSFPDRADLKYEHIRKCVEAGVKMAIDSDSHSAGHLKYLEFGVAQARRGWCGKNDIINAWPIDKMLKFLK